MPLTVAWHDIALRLALTVLAGVVIGLNRSERGRPAGLRTTLLVCLAASVSMIQTNLLLTTTGKTPESFAVMDMMRLPLGILTGMGFIGAGAILRRGDRVQGVTTAATMWFVTVIGLCFGGGQHGLGLAALALAVMVLWFLKRVELTMRRDCHAMLILHIAADGPTEAEVRSTVRTAGYETADWNIVLRGRGETRRLALRCEVRWRDRETEVQPPAFLHELAQRPGVVKLQWQI